MKETEIQQESSNQNYSSQVSVYSSESTKDLVAVDQKCQQMIIKQYNEAIDKAFNIKKKRIFKKKKKILQIMVRPNTFDLMDQNRIFYLYGGLLLPCDFSYEAKRCFDSRQNIKQGIRPLQYIEKKKNYSIMNFSYNFKGLETFEFLINIYMNKGKQEYYNLALVLKQFQINIQLWKKQAQLIAPMRLKNFEGYMQEYQKFVQECTTKVDQLDQSKFYLFGFIMYNYETDNIEQKTVGFSKGFLSLLGTDQDQFNNISLRTGDQNYYQGDTFLNAIVISLLPFACKDVIFQKSVADTIVFTYDGFQIPCKEIRSYYLPENHDKYNFFEMGFGLVEYDVSIPMLQQLLTLRARKYYIEQNKELEFCSDSSFEYSMNSQLFIEKHYPNAITNEFLRCRYQYLDQMNQKTNNLQVMTSISQVPTNSFSTDDLAEVSYSDLNQSTAQKDSIKSCFEGYQSSFLQITDDYGLKQVITEDNFECIIQKNLQQQLNKIMNMGFLQQNQGLGVSQSLEQNQQKNEQQQQLQLANLNENLGVSHEIKEQVEMQIEPFMYLGEGHQTEQNQLNKIKQTSEVGLNMMFEHVNDQNNNYLFLKLKNKEQEVFKLKNSFKDPLQKMNQEDTSFKYVEFLSDHNKSSSKPHF